MTRGLTPDQEAAYMARNCVAVQLWEVIFRSGVLRLVPGRLPVTDGAGRVWYAAKSLSFDEVTESADQLERFGFTLTGLDPAINAIAAGENYYRCPLNLYEAVLNPDTYQVIGEPVLEWPGRLVSLVLADEGRSVTVQGTAERADAEEGTPRVDYYNAGSQQRRFPADTGFDQVEQMTEVTLVWPSKQALKK